MTAPKSQLAILATALCCATIAQAQLSSVQGENLPILALTASATYDSNVARSSADLAALRGIFRQDEIYAPAVQIDFSRNFGLEAVFIRGLAGYDFYQRNSVLNREHIDLAAGIERTFGPCEVSAGGTYVRQQSSLQDLAAPVTRNTEADSTASLHTVCDRGARIAGYFSVLPTSSNNSAPTLETSNSRSLRVEGGFTYKQPELGEISIFGQYNSTVFPHRTLSQGSSSVSDGYNLYGGGLRFDRKFGRRFEIVASLSGISLSPRAAASPAFNGIAYEADAIFNLTPRLEIDLSAIKAANPSDRLNTTYSIDNTYRVAAVHRLGKRMKLTLDGNVGNQHFFGAQINNGVDLTRQSIRSVDGALSYALNSGFSINLTVTREDGGADIPAYQYTDNRVGLSLTAGF